MGYEALDKNTIWEKVAHLPRKVDSEGSQWQRPNLRIKVFILPLSVAVFQSNWDHGSAEAIMEILALFMITK